MLKNEDELKEFLKEFPKPRVVLASTMYDGYATCIKPIKTICGAEIMCSPATVDEVRRVIRSA